MENCAMQVFFSFRPIRFLFDLIRHEIYFHSSSRFSRFPRSRVSREYFIVYCNKVLYSDSEVLLLFQSRDSSLFPVLEELDSLQLIKI